MTIDEFFDRLAQTPRDWYQDDYAIRRVADDMDAICCPISALDETDAIDWIQAARRCEMDLDDAGKIVYAADKFAGFDPTLRQRLLVACGLTEDRQ